MSGMAFNQVGEATISMSVDFADYNKDGLMDLFVSDDVYCSLYKNGGNGVFSEMSYNSGIAVACGQFVGWSSSFLDYDNDGDLICLKSMESLNIYTGRKISCLKIQVTENLMTFQQREVLISGKNWLAGGPASAIMIMMETLMPILLI